MDIVIGVDVLLLAQASPAALGITHDVIDAVNRLSRRRVFDLRLVTPSTGDEGTAREDMRVVLRGGVEARAIPIGRTRPRGIVVVPGLGAATQEELHARMGAADVSPAARWLVRAWRSGAEVGASCTGVFLLGEAGLLDGRRCTSTWWLLHALTRRYPRAKAEPSAMLCAEDRVWSAGAAFAHIDLMLGLVAPHVGPALLEAAARHLVVEGRPSQARFVIPSFLAAHDPLASRVGAIVERRLAAPHTLATLAKDVSVTPRTLARRITAATGLSPMRFVQKIRVEAALHRLETTRDSVEAIAAAVGFEDPSALYRLLRRHTGRGPSAFRARRP